MFNKKPSRAQNRIDSLIGSGTSIVGDITFSGGLRIDGEVIGNVSARDGQPATLVVSEHAKIEGKVSVSHAVVNGAILGPVRAVEFLELQAKARVTGDVEYTNIEIHLGAIVQGRLMHEGAPARSVELKLAARN
jgi:cytoskeletal protein CcmA (bactofilin family)